MKVKTLYFILFIFLFFHVTANVNLTLTTAYESLKVTVFVKGGLCSYCPGEKEEWELQQQYINDLKRTLNFSQFEERYLVALEDYQDLDNLYQNLSIPDSVQALDMVVIVDQKFLFVSYVPIEIITDFFVKYAGSHNKFVILKDALHSSLYSIWDGEGQPLICEIENSIGECTYASSPISGTWIMGGALIIFAALVFFILRRKSR